MRGAAVRYVQGRRARRARRQILQCQKPLEDVQTSDQNATVKNSPASAVASGIGPWGITEVGCLWAVAQLCQFPAGALIPRVFPLGLMSDFDRDRLAGTFPTTLPRCNRGKPRTVPDRTQPRGARPGVQGWGQARGTMCRSSRTRTHTTSCIRLVSREKRHCIL